MVEDMRELTIDGVQFFIETTPVFLLLIFMRYLWSISIFRSWKGINGIVIAIDITWLGFYRLG